MSKKILVVEDELFLLNFLKFRLSKEGYDVTTAVDGKEAEMYISEGEFDLIIADVLLPFVSGFELLQRIKERQNNVPVLIISGLGQEDAIIKGLSLGAYDFLPKPFSINVFTTKVKLLMHKDSQVSIQN